MTDELHPTAAGFDRVGEVYERSRPGYPPEAVALVAERTGIGPGRRVLDLAAGTGKLTRAWVDRDADVVAVEPVDGMRRVLERELPGVTALDGRAEALPLPAADVDVATVGHAFHWFDADAALDELHRVLRAGGWLAVLFNRRDLATPVQAAIDALLAPHRGDTPSWATHDWPHRLESSPRFRDLELAAFPFAQRLDTAGLAGRVASISFVAQLDDRTRARLMDAVGAIFAASARPDEDGVERVEVAHVCEVRLVRRADAS